MCLVALPAMAAMMSSTSAMVATSVAAAGASMLAQQQQAAAQAKLIGAQESQQQSQISQQAGQQANQLAMQARANRAKSTVAAAASGVAGSASVGASIQSEDEMQHQQMGLITQNEQNQRSASAVEAQSEMASKASSPTFMGALTNLGLTAAAAGVRGYTAANKPGAAPVSNPDYSQVNWSGLT